MSALRRVVRAPGLWVSLYALQLALALVLARPLRAAVSAALEPFAYTGPLEGLLMTFGRLSSQNAAVMAVATSALVTGTLLGLLLWIVAGGGIIRRLAGPCKPGEAFAAAITYTPKIALVTLYVEIPRGLVVFLTVGDPLGAPLSLRVVALALGWIACTLALDIARSRVVLAGARVLDPRALLAAFAELGRSPRRTALAAVIACLQAGVVAGIALLVIWFFGQPWTLWAARGLALVGVGLALWRVACAVERVDAQP